MGNKRKAVEFTIEKVFYRPGELTEIFDMTEKEIVRFAFGFNALYKVKGIHLVNLPVLKEGLTNYQSLMENADGTFMELDDAVRVMGLSENVVVKISAEANALFQVGGFRLIDVKLLDEYIRKFPVVIDDIRNLDELEPKKLRGSRIIRDIYKNQ